MDTDEVGRFKHGASRPAYGTDGHVAGAVVVALLIIGAAAAAVFHNARELRDVPDAHSTGTLSPAPGVSPGALQSAYRHCVELYLSHPLAVVSPSFPTLEQLRASVPDAVASTGSSRVTIHAFAEGSLPGSGSRTPFRCDLSFSADGAWVGGVDLRPEHAQEATTTAAPQPARVSGDRRIPASPAKNLAIIEAQDPEPSLSDVADFDVILTRLAQHCTESETGVSDVMVNMQRELRRRGYERTLRQVGAMLTATVPDQSRTSCADVGAVDILLLQQFGD